MIEFAFPSACVRAPLLECDVSSDYYQNSNFNTWNQNGEVEATVVRTLE